MTLLEKNIELAKKRNKIIINYEDYLVKINNAIKNLVGDVKVFLFGSVLRDEQVALSDIDLLIVGDIPRKHLIRAEILADIEDKANLPLYHPFGMHLIDDNEFIKWKEIYNLKLLDFTR